jgi:Zn-finger protein
LGQFPYFASLFFFFLSTNLLAMPGFSKPLFLGALLFGLIYGAANLSTYAPTRFHSNAELKALRAMMADPVDPNIIFPTVAACVGCHGRDESGYASTDLAGNDVNVVDDWSATMMANSARDPFWRAKVSHEIFLYPMHSASLQDKCTSCHAPNGHYTAHYRGHGPYSIADLIADSIGLEGVNCASCHMISQQDFGLTHSGDIRFDTNRVLYGPYYQPFSAPMIDFVGFEPLHGPHIPEAGTCAPCHTLITHPYDLEGNATGTAFIEQATYHEWLNSNYGLQNVTCQDCHFPRIKDPVVISSNYLFLEGRVPYGLHEMAGANTMMLKLMKDNRQSLGIKASPENFDKTIAATFAMLQEKSLQLELLVDDVRSDSVTFALKLTNLAGHKFPSGYPSRRALVSFVALTEQGDTLFKSGILQPDYEVEGHNADFEPHYQLITRPDQAQIYEMVLADVNNQPTTVLARAFATLKDNRLPPIGFSTTHSTYDTTRIYGAALQDPDFNKHLGVQGTGADIIRYRVGIAGYAGHLDVRATVFYQSLPPKWMQEMFSINTPEIDSFRIMFNNADRSPVAVKSANISSLFVNGVTATNNPSPLSAITIFPNPSSDGFIVINAHQLQIQGIRVFNLQGKLLQSFPAQTNRIQLPGKGIFMVRIQTNEGDITKKIIVR